MEFQPLLHPKSEYRYGRSRGGTPLVEYLWGDREKSVLFLSGLSQEDAPLSSLLFRWNEDLLEGNRQGGILGDFDLKILKNKCRIRTVPLFNPDLFKINQNGISYNFEAIQNPLQIKDFTEITPCDTQKLRGVDLNRNFNANWVKMQRKNPQRGDAGPFPESEPEVAFFTARMKASLPQSAVILRRGNPTLLYPFEATKKEVREAVFLGQYASLPVALAADTDATPLQWLTDRGVKTVEVHLPAVDEQGYPKLRDFLTMCAALT